MFACVDTLSKTRKKGSESKSKLLQEVSTYDVLYRSHLCMHVHAYMYKQMHMYNNMQFVLRFETAVISIPVCTYTAFKTCATAS